jgi:endonuclease/exonuclease/phosphatase family metal-dependent hydrolase
MLKLLTYNVLEGAVPDRLPKALRVMKSAKADVVAVQEARYWRRNGREVFRRVSGELGMRGVLFKANSGFDIAVFSRLPILGHANLALETVFLHTTGYLSLQTDSGLPFHLFATHLRPEYPARQWETELLLKWVRPRRREYCAMCGDLNSLTAGDHVARTRLRPGSELRRGPQGVIAMIERGGWVDCFRHRNPCAPGLTLGARRRVARVDYIFASKSLSERLRGCRVLRHRELVAASDHSPVWAEFDI